MNKQPIVLIIAVVFMLVVVSVAQAGSCSCPGTDEVDSVTIQFQCDDLNVTWSHSSGDSSIVLVGTIDTLFAFEFYEDPFGSYSLDFDPPLSPATTVIVLIGILADSGMTTVAFSMLEVNCDPVSGATSASPCADGRVTFTLCQPLVVYPVVSDDGVGWTVYLADPETGLGQFMLYVPAEVFDALPDEVPANCTIDSSRNGQVVLYRLSSGQYQLNVGPDAEGKIFVYIFNDLLSAPVSIDTYISGLPPEILTSCT